MNSCYWRIGDKQIKLEMELQDYNEEAKKWRSMADTVRRYARFATYPTSRCHYETEAKRCERMAKAYEDRANHVQKALDNMK